MKKTKIIMDMPVTLEIVDTEAKAAVFEDIFAYFHYIDKKFSIYKKDSEISLINKGLVSKDKYSQDMKAIFNLAELTKNQTDGYFDISHQGKYDPSGIVKGWAISKAAAILKKKGFVNFYVEAGGDIEAVGKNEHGQPWRVGIRHPFNTQQIVKVLGLENKGVATSGTYIRGQHIYNPKNGLPISEIVSLTVVGPDVYEADRFATAAFAMGKRGIEFIERLPGFEGYLIDKNGLATKTSHFTEYLYHE